jgi:hypothetical protein
VPLQYERPAAGTRVTIPPAYVSYRRIVEGIPRAPTLESPYPADMDLRFQMPAAAGPMAVERATLHLRVRAPSRRVTVHGLADGQAVPLHSEDNPSEPIRIEIPDGRLLRLDDRGGLLLRLAVTNLGGSQLDSSWKIESLGLEVVGRVGQSD